MLLDERLLASTAAATRKGTLWVSSTPEVKAVRTSLLPRQWSAFSPLTTLCCCFCGLLSSHWRRMYHLLSFTAGGGLVPPPMTLSGYTAMAFIGCQLSTSFHFYCCCIGQIPQVLFSMNTDADADSGSCFHSHSSSLLLSSLKENTFLLDLWPDFAVTCGYWWWWCWWCLLLEHNTSEIERWRSSLSKVMSVPQIAAVRLRLGRNSAAFSTWIAGAVARILSTCHLLYFMS